MIYQMTKKNSIIDAYTFACRRMIHQQSNHTDTAVYVSFRSSKDFLFPKREENKAMRDNDKKKKAFVISLN
jgi:hypothetical protein